MGLPGAGKTTIGKRLERECPALLLSPDVWMARVVGDGYDADRRRAVQQLQLELADKVLRLGRDVVLEFGFFRRVERDVARTLASNAGAEAQLIFLDPPFEELVKRVEARNRDLPADTFSITQEHLELCATWLERPLPEEEASVYR
ncbi:ATP-binding protein (plasmid) [Rhizobium sp. CB3090]|nr:ATP-binding protein [Rhizobium sp. CB3090]WFU12736.1 ATP-binding protein [Rhizobium sp. CB3090]